MEVQIRLRVQRVLVHHTELTHHVIENRVLVCPYGIVRIERLTHIQTVEPHLPWIHFLVPEPAFRGARLSC